MNGLHLFQLFARREVSPHPCYAWVCAFLAPLYASSVFIDLSALLGDSRWAHALSGSDGEKYLWGFAANDALACYSWANTGYLFHILSKGGARRARAASAAPPLV